MESHGKVSLPQYSYVIVNPISHQNSLGVHWLLVLEVSDEVGETTEYFFKNFSGLAITCWIDQFFDQFYSG